jgi:hypothetical protein
MAQTRTQIGIVIAGLVVGDSVEVIWEKSGNRSVEEGKVWQPPSTNYLGIGPDLLNPTDTELVNIVVTQKAPVQVPLQPAIGSVAIFKDPRSLMFFPYKRVNKKGWYTANSLNPYPWSTIVALLGTPFQVFSPGTPPAAPVLNTATPGDRRINIVSTLGSAGSSAVTDVQYQLVFAFEIGEQETTGWVSSGQTTGTFSIVNLTNGLAFTVRIRAINSNGTGPSSNALTATPAAP